MPGSVNAPQHLIQGQRRPADVDQVAEVLLHQLLHDEHVGRRDAAAVEAHNVGVAHAAQNLDLLQGITGSSGTSFG